MTQKYHAPPFETYSPGLSGPLCTCERLGQRQESQVSDCYKLKRGKVQSQKFHCHLSSMLKQQSILEQIYLYFILFYLFLYLCLYFILYYIMLFVLFYFTLFYFKLFVLFYILLYYFICFILFILFYIILYYLFYFILFYFNLFVLVYLFYFMSMQ